MKIEVSIPVAKALAIHVVELVDSALDPLQQLVLGRDILFSTQDLESYSTANWDSVVFDAMVIGAAVEYCDRILRRSALIWGRDFRVHVPVHDPDRWNAPAVRDALQDALGFLTGDRWQFEFSRRKNDEPPPRQGSLELPPRTEATLAFSDGMDSRAVAGLVRNELGSALVRVRLGSKRCDRPRPGEPFTAVPYKLKKQVPYREPSARNRGFRFALISGLASYICNARRIVIPESGQGALGPVVAPVAHAYPDYRNHPAFLKRMERFLEALLGHEVEYVFPRIWSTKGETLAAYLALGSDRGEWKRTRSCWKSAQWSSVQGEFRQCGACAACMLRRLSVHAAGESEPDGTYMASDLSAPTLEEAVPPSFNKLNKSFREYVIAGDLHMDHLADLATDDGAKVLRREARELAAILGLTAEEAEKNIKVMISRHADEWRAFVAQLGERSFLQNWIRGSR